MSEAQIPSVARGPGARGWTCRTGRKSRLRARLTAHLLTQKRPGSDAPGKAKGQLAVWEEMEGTRTLSLRVLRTARQVEAGPSCAPGRLQASERCVFDFVVGMPARACRRATGAFLALGCRRESVMAAAEGPVTSCHLRQNKAAQRNSLSPTSITGL